MIQMPCFKLYRQPLDMMIHIPVILMGLSPKRAGQALTGGVESPCSLQRGEREEYAEGIERQNDTGNGHST